MATQESFGGTTLIYFSSFPEPVAFLRKLGEAPVIYGKGRGGIRIVEMRGLKIAVRQYRHGGLFRALTGSRFLTERRAVEEADVTGYLRRSGFPTVEPLCVIAERRLLFTRLRIATVYQENRGDLLQSLQSGTTKERRRLITQFARDLWRMEEAGVYHPDLHLRNVLVTDRRDLVFLDFDRARRKQIVLKDMIAMLRRLSRFADKMGRQRRFSATRLEKALFLRTYQRLSGRDLASALEASAKRTLLHQVGWFVESLIYGKTADPSDQSR